jgi:type IV secretion system protein VirB6
MAGFCSAPDPDVGLVQGLLSSVDCNAQVLARAGYGVIAEPGSPFAAALTLLLTLYIALMGFRLMLGLGSLRVGELTMTALKIGLILALATNWAAYQQLIFTTLDRGPEQWAGSILRSINPTDGTLAATPFGSLQFVYDELQRSAQFYAQHGPAQGSALQGGMGFAAMGLNLSALLLLMNSLGVLLAAKIVLALLLAVGPVFVALLLFDATRGVFEGWLRAAVGFALVPLFAMLGLVIQLTLLEPQILQLADLRADNQVNLGLASGILLLSLVLSLVIGAMMLAIGVIAVSFRLPAALKTLTVSAAPPTAGMAAASAAPGPYAAADSRPGRAAQVAMAAATMDRRDARAAGAAPSPARLLRSSSGPGGVSPIEPFQGRVLGVNQRRSAQPRRSASNSRRDG